MEISGRIHRLFETEQVTASFKKREVVIVTEETYPQYISINFVQDKCDILNNYKEGDNVTVSINLRGKEYTNKLGETKYFNDIQGWRIQKAEIAPAQSEPQTHSEPSTEIDELEHDDLPF